MNKDGNILIACEESQIVCKCFRDLGFYNTFSCDLLPTSGMHPEWHIKGDAIKILNSCIWDLVIAFPPCTRLANSGRRWIIERNLFGELESAIEFFNVFVEYGKAGNKILIENPIQHDLARKKIRKYDQIIHPWQFGHMEQKQTCLWLYGLPKLKETNNVYNEMMKLEYKERAKVHNCSPGPERAKLRSKTFPGIAKAMAEQFTQPFILQGSLF